MKFLKALLNLILAFVLVCSILGVTGVCYLKNKIINKDYAKQMLEENNFFENMKESIEDGFTDYIYQSGLPEDTIVNLAKDEYIKEDINSIVEYVFEGKELKLNTDTIKSDLDKRITDYVREQGRILSKEDKDSVIKFENLIVKTYEQKLLYSRSVLDTVKDSMTEIVSLYEKVKYIPIIALIVSLLLIIIVNSKTKLVIINIIGIGFLSSGILLKVLERLLFNKIDIDYVLVLSKAVSSFVQAIFKDVVYGLGNLGVVYIIIGICSILFYSIVQSNNVKTEKKKERMKERV